jgi:hypothetical protein
MKNGLTLLIMGILLGACSSPAPTTQSNAPAASASPTATKPADETSALDAIRKTTEAQATYFKINRRYALNYEELVEAHLLTSEPSAGQTGYDFKLRPAADAQTYKLSVAPADSGASAGRRFFADQTGVIHAETDKDASVESPTLK